MNEKTYRGIIKSVYSGRNYALCDVILEGEGNDPDTEIEVTFNLSIWTDTKAPRKNQIALLTGVTEYENGWRAEKASPNIL